MLLRCSFAVPKLPSTYSRTHSTMKEEHNERAGGERGAERRLSYIAMQVTHANLLLRSSPAHYRTYQRDPKVHWPGWPAGSTSRPRVRRRGRRAGPREIAVLVTPTLPILPPPPPVMPPVVVVVPSVPSVPTRVAVVVGEGASSPPARMRGRGRSSRRRETRARARHGERGRDRRGAARAAARARARAAAAAAHPRLHPHPDPDQRGAAGAAGAAPRGRDPQQRAGGRGSGREGQCGACVRVVAPSHHRREADRDTTATADEEAAS